MSIQSERNQDVRIKNKQEIREIEQGYVDSELKVLTTIVEAKRHEIENKLIEYTKGFTVTKYTKEGEPYEVPNTNPLLIQKYFFQSINPLVNVEPEYSAEKLGIIWQLYEEMVGKVNAQIGIVVPNLSSFCASAGIRLSTFKGYKNSVDESMRIVVEKIEDGCFDNNVMLAQMGYVKERSTVYRMKSEQERVEKEAPQVDIHKDVTDLKAIQNRLSELKGFSEKKKAIEVEYTYGESEDK